MGDFEAIGDVVTGAVVAGAVEPRAGRRSADGHTHESACLNCGAPLAGPYCHECGQRGHVHRTIAAFFHDLLHGVFHFEGKVLNTLPMLAWRPGELTRRYIDGQRARFVSPMALFLFAVFLMFAVISAVGSPVGLNTNGAKGGVSDSRVKADAAVATLERDRQQAIAAKQPTAAIDKKLEDARGEAQILKSIEDRGFVKGTAVRISDDLPPWLAKPVEAAAKNPDLLFYKLQNNAYKYSWALIPISLPFMWLLFPFSRRYRAYDHIVFVTYSLAFMTLLVVAASLIGIAGFSTVAGFASLIPPIHMFRQLRGAYDLGVWGALWRTLLLTLFATIAILLFVALLFALGLFD